MRRADRLFRLLDVLRRRKQATGQALAEELEVSLRTLYRDVADLIASGVPIRGEAGVGYVLEKGFDLPPLMFRAEELEALVLGIRMVRAWTDPSLARAAEQALARIETVLPASLRTSVRSTPFLAPDFHVPAVLAERLELLRTAVRARRHVQLEYSDKAGDVSERKVRPLGLSYWGTGWTLIAWCELRDGFRNFRLDRMQSIKVQNTEFVLETGRTLDDFVREMESETRALESARVSSQTT